MADTELMAPDGDIVLVVDSAAKKIRVSSNVFSAASPVFKTILDPKLQGGKRPRGPVEVPLPEDDPDTMLLFRHLLHFDSLNASDNLTLSSEAIFNLVLLADKYSAITAIRWQVRSALLAWLLNNPETSEVIEFGRIITAAYMVNCSKAFEKATAQLIMGSAGRLSVLLNATFNKVLPARILVVLDERRDARQYRSHDTVGLCLLCVREEKHPSNAKEICKVHSV
ncbi:hypothetical protein CBER1_10315 [Cercospora berteroae]|uniref:BTB domain-containing protein n=1 Tax=Cercospora berteroae TaxID=357750 RepID=A0A2S6BYA4_9PEZI|nr:hypothetical protein CBER1_10315 [Cercospora berteroae]